MESVGPFQILERLGAGALGEVLRARDTRHDRTVALRVVVPHVAGDPAVREALVADARAAIALAHPHVAALLDIVDEGDRLLLVHEYIVGQPLASLMTGRSLDVRVAVRLAAQTAEALAAASAMGLVHGALDPTHVLITSGDQVKILDFGLSRWTSSGKARAAVARALESGGSETTDADMNRAARYASPEQVLGSSGDGRSDVFSLGAIFQEMLTGRPLFAGDTIAATGLNVLQVSPGLPSDSNPAVPPEADRIAQRALAKSVGARYRDAAAMASDLRALEAAEKERRRDAAERWVASSDDGKAAVSAPRRRANRKPRLVLGIVVLALLAAAASWFGWNALVLLQRDREVAPARQVVMVLPFGGGGPNVPAYFGPGFAEDVAARLSEIPGTTVVGRGSIRAVGGAGDWRVRARELGATIAVKGTVRPDQYALHAEVEVLDVETGAVAWTGHFSREPRQVSALQAEIAGRLGQHLRLTTPTSTRWARASVRQIDPQAYDLYLQGRDAADRRDRSRAIGLFDQALQRDPRLVEARASLSLALYLEEYYAGGTREPATAGRALREAEAALAVDSELPAAHLAAALAAPTVTLSASALARALAFDPSNGEAWHHAGDLVGGLDPRRSVAFYRESLALEPTIDANWRDIASAQALMGDRTSAEQSVVKGEAVRPDRPWWKQMRARLDTEQQRYDHAIELLQGDPSVESTPIVWLMGRVVPMSLAGRNEEALAEVNRLAERYPAFCEGRALLAGLEMDGGLPDAGRALGAAILAEAGRNEAEPPARVCAALAAAAIGDAAEAASWLSRIAGDDRALRVWTRQAIYGVGLSFRAGWYPWTKVAGSQPVKVAAGQLDQSLARLREEVERRLPAPPQQNRGRE
jgi:TolB-like protein